MFKRRDDNFAVPKMRDDGRGDQRDDFKRRFSAIENRMTNVPLNFKR